MNLLEDDKKFWAALFEENQLVLQLPTLLTADAIYPSSHSGNVKVKALRGSGLGDNVMSDTFSITAISSDSNSTEHSRTGFIKVLPSNPVMRETAWNGKVHVREIGVYRDFFQVLREIRGDRPVSLDVPELLYARLDDNKDLSCILLQDLKMEGYRMADKTQGSDYNHSLLAVTSLANYHALSIAALRKWIQTDPEDNKLVINYPDNLKFLVGKPLFDPFDPKMIMKDWIGSSIQFAKDLQRPDLEGFLQDAAGRLTEIIQPDTLETCGKMACLMHGDYWNNNFMFRYNRFGKPVALKMLDFQYVRLGHPLNDLLYFFYTSTLPELREKHLMGLFRHYFDVLCSKLDLLEVDVDFTWDEFLMEFKRRSLMLGLMSGMVISCVLNSSVMEDMSDLESKSLAKAQGEDNKSFELEEQMTEIFKRQKLSENPLLKDLLLKLVVEIKALNES